MTCHSSSNVSWYLSLKLSYTDGYCCILVTYSLPVMSVWPLERVSMCEWQRLCWCNVACSRLRHHDVQQPDDQAVLSLHSCVLVCRWLRPATQQWFELFVYKRLISDVSGRTAQKTSPTELHLCWNCMPRHIDSKNFSPVDQFSIYSKSKSQSSPYSDAYTYRKYKYLSLLRFRFVLRPAVFAKSQNCIFEPPYGSITYRQCRRFTWKC